jgi:diphthine-ammonia ligase
VLVKVAGVGLEPHKHLGMDLGTLLPTLKRLNSKYGLDLCGEGGEYESLVLDCPLFRRRLVLDETRVALDLEDTSVGNLIVVSCHTEEKLSHRPPLPISGTPLNISEQTVIRGDPPHKSPLITWPLRQDDLALTQSLLLLPSPCDPLTAPQVAVSYQLREILTNLAVFLRTHSGDGVEMDIADALFVHLYLASDETFNAANAEYSLHFGTQPPSRSCITVRLPAGVHVAMDALLLLRSARSTRSPPSARRVLHVQSLSQVTDNIST